MFVRVKYDVVPLTIVGLIWKTMVSQNPLLTITFPSKTGHKYIWYEAF